MCSTWAKWKSIAWDSLINTTAHNFISSASASVWMKTKQIWWVSALSLPPPESDCLILSPECEHQHAEPACCLTLGQILQTQVTAVSNISFLLSRWPVTLYKCVSPHCVLTGRGWWQLGMPISCLIFGPKEKEIHMFYINTLFGKHLEDWKSGNLHWQLAAPSLLYLASTLRIKSSWGKTQLA